MVPQDADHEAHGEAEVDGCFDGFLKRRGFRKEELSREVFDFLVGGEG